jgi:hypothetical protein
MKKLLLSLGFSLLLVTNVFAGFTSDNLTITSLPSKSVLATNSDGKIIAGSLTPWTSDINGTTFNLTTTGSITAGSFIGGVSINNKDTSSGTLSILEDSDDGIEWTKLQVPALAANITYTLPPDDGGVGEQLQTDGSGVLTWEAAGGAAVGDVTAVGDCADSACFGGAAGTNLIFNDAGGDGTLDYDGTSFTIDKPFVVTGLVTSSV